MEIWRQQYLSLPGALGKIHRPDLLLPCRREASKWEEVKATSWLGTAGAGGLVVGGEKKSQDLGADRRGCGEGPGTHPPGSTAPPPPLKIVEWMVVGPWPAGEGK